MSKSSLVPAPASPGSSRPRWLRLALSRRGVVTVGLLAAGVIALAIVVVVSRAGAGHSGSGDAAVHSIPTNTAAPTSTPPPTGTALPAPAAPTAGAPEAEADPRANGLPAPAASLGGDANSARGTTPDEGTGSPRGTNADGDVTSAPGARPEGDADVPRASERDATSPRTSQDGVTGSPGSTSPNIIPPETPPVIIGQTGPTILSFAPTSPVAMCANEFTAKVPLDFRWSTQDASEGWFAAGTTNALFEDATPVDLASQTLSDVVFDCSDNQQIYALTISDGSETVSATTVVVRRLIWPDG
jgi:hypothetical protein